MTKFDKSKFTYHGGYLEYTGTYEGQPTWDQVAPNCHPSRVGIPKELFIARFKYSNSPIKMGAFKRFLVKNFTVEEYVEMRSGNDIDSSPLKVLERKGFTY